MLIRIHLGPWIQRYKMRGKAEVKQKILGFFLKEIIFFKLEPLKGLGLDMKLFFFIKRWIEINLVMLLTWIRNRIHQILWIRIHITVFFLSMEKSPIEKMSPWPCSPSCRSRRCRSPSCQGRSV